MAAKPTLSVVVPTYNCAPLMERHLASMAAWTDLADEIIVVDSRSTDGTLDLIRSRLRHPNLRIIERDRGLYQSWNEGIAATTGDWVYISTAGDTIERDHLLHLLDLGERAAADVVISPPRFVDEAGAPFEDLRWPPHEIIAKHGSGQPFTMSPMATACLAFLHCPSCVLGSSASNLYRGDILRARPFPVGFRGASDTVWLMRNALSLRVCLTPQYGSTFCIHPKYDRISQTEAEAFMLQFFQEKAALAQDISEADPSREWSALAEEAGLYAHTRTLHQARRTEWSAAKSNPMAIGRWLWLTAVYGWHRARLSQRRRTILGVLLAKKFAGESYFQPVS
ncbi:MAG: glycosyltransferase [Verrucomicrobiota bacterium]|jgi:glycosyltransferase involved in cell wall biosynthesis